jgi:hypothetical protein
VAGPPAGTCCLSCLWGELTYDVGHGRWTGVSEEVAVALFRKDVPWGRVDPYPRVVYWRSLG